MMDQHNWHPPKHYNQPNYQLPPLRVNNTSSEHIQLPPLNVLQPEFAARPSKYVHQPCHSSSAPCPVPTRPASPTAEFDEASSTEHMPMKRKGKYKFTDADMVKIARVVVDKNPYLAPYSKKGAAWEAVHDVVVAVLGRCKDVEPDSIRGKMEGLIAHHKVTIGFFMYYHCSSDLFHSECRFKVQV
jgi:hypothetical protein